jgi:hypothetical protein
MKPITGPQPTATPTPTSHRRSHHQPDEEFFRSK